MPTITLTDSDFNQKITTALVPVLVDFWAPWCGPCKVQGPILDELAEEIGEKAVIAKLNVDENQQTSSQYGVMSIPTLILFKGGKPVEQMVGLQDKQYIKKKIEAAL
ncbi:MAG: thioredoxin [Candidatus Doudnabacteria bacterium]|nr:thioredoxin [Candidatus Doudnabacteria bacterium]